MLLALNVDLRMDAISEERRKDAVSGYPYPTRR